MVWGDSVQTYLSAHTSNFSTPSDLAWLQQQLSRFAYKPGWSLAIGPAQATAGYGQYSLSVFFFAPDACHPEREIKIGGSYRVPFYLGESRDEAHFARWLASVLMEIEHHEQREWLRRDGVTYDDPHASQ